MLTVLCGLPGSGKTTWRQAQAADAAAVCLDDIRGELTGDAGCQRFNDNVMMVAIGRIRDALEDGRDVIIDATNLTAASRALWVELAEECDQPARCVYFPIPLAVALTRNTGRDRQVPDSAMLRMGRCLEVPRTSEGFDQVLVMPQGENR